LPSCEATTVQVPEARKVTVAGELDPEIEHTVPRPANTDKKGARPDDVEAVTEYVPPGNGWAGTLEVIAIV
jgi:hypothetical protein